jgi:hypothetical protein
MNDHESGARVQALPLWPVYTGLSDDIMLPNLKWTVKLRRQNQRLLTH